MARFGEAPCKGGYLAALPERVLRELDVPTLFLAAGTCGMLHGLARVLVPLDGTAYAESMIPLARDLLPEGSGSLHLLLILPGQAWSRAVRHLRGLPTSRAAAEAYLDRVAARPELAGVDVERSLLVGVDPAAAIDRVAHEINASLVAMMARDHGPLGRAVLGSITHQLLKDLRVPLLAWRSPARAHLAKATPSAN